ncbi:CAMK family protein kinase [Tritrichomonas foetus]|uniref:CAMK family protein kinase n=1 Tax=Tritrichomonas foetus TaxID=1144522 RepID=A0A1J4J7U7_9EUKA|nr:CAMK family protein kinase [Tritrichomonas foetus]|eukprot:OHS93300.1 CAMK family protein kinase [Tritrichomonas foetus]
MSSWSALPPFIEKYNLGHTLGKGSFSLVKEGQDTETKLKYAIKIIPKTNMNTPQDIERFDREVRVILKMNHPGIIKIFDFLVDNNFFYLVMELCSGDTLVKQIPPPGTIDEERAKPIFKQILDVIKYIHEQGIAHRDLKLENALLDTKGHIKLIDFGFSRFADPGQMFATPCGSPAYAAPEVIGGSSYDGKAADMWSCGVLLFSLVTGELPWKAGNRVQVFGQIQNGSFEMPEGLSKFCKDLISKLLVPEANLRLTAEQAYSHPWMQDVEISWDNDVGIKPVFSASAFSKIISNSGSSFGSQPSPRSMLKQIGARSFGPKTKATMPTPCRFAPRMVPINKENLVMRPPSMSLVQGLNNGS